MQIVREAIKWLWKLYTGELLISCYIEISKLRLCDATGKKDKRKKVWKLTSWETSLQGEGNNHWYPTNVQMH